jgi:hypothetical protein
VQHGSRLRVGRQLSAFVAVAVGEKDQPPLEAAQHQQAGRRNTVAGCTGDGHGTRHRLAGRPGRVQHGFTTVSGSSLLLPLQQLTPQWITASY